MQVRRHNFVEKQDRKAQAFDERAVRGITFAVILGLVAAIHYLHPAFIYH